MPPGPFNKKPRGFDAQLQNAGSKHFTINNIMFYAYMLLIVTKALQWAGNYIQPFDLGTTLIWSGKVTGSEI